MAKPGPIVLIERQPCAVISRVYVAEGTAVRCQQPLVNAASNRVSIDLLYTERHYTDGLRGIDDQAYVATFASTRYRYQVYERSIGPMTLRQTQIAADTPPTRLVSISAPK